jgi:Spy/CpxP family protein refolding chaperone
MRKLQLVLVAALVVGASAVATAQDPQPQGQRQGGRGMGMGMLMQGITLTAEQQAKVDSINARYMTVRRAIMQADSLDQDTRRAKGRELMGKQRDEIKALLTDEQKKVFDRNVEEMQARMQQGGGRLPQR